MGASTRGTVRAWRPPIQGVREVLHASFREHAYPPHTHDCWTLFVVDDGAIRYDLDRQAMGAEPTIVSILPPHVVHDGRPATSRGYVKRVVYLDNGILGDELIGRAVDDPVLRGRAIRRKVSALIDALGCADMLEAETRLAFLVEQIRSSLGAGRAVDAEAPKERLAEEFRAYLDRNLFERATVADAAAEIGASPTKLARIFAATYRIPPHAYVTGRRLEAARQRILDGRALAEVAAEVGFADQAHLTRRFASFLGVTPGEFARGRRHTV